MAVVEFGKNPVDLVKGIYDYWGSGAPTTPLTNAVIGSLFRQTDATNQGLWVKTSTAWENLVTPYTTHQWASLQEFVAEAAQTNITATGAAIRVRERAALGYPTEATYGPRIGFYWSGLIATQLVLATSGAIEIRKENGASFEDFAAAAGTFSGNVSGVNGTFSGNLSATGTLAITGISTFTGQVVVNGGLKGLTASALGAQTGAQITLAKLGAGAAVNNAAQQKWLPITGSDSVQYYVPAFT